MARVLARRTRLSRRVAGSRSDEQVLAANVDLVLVVHAVDAGVKPRRIERTLAAVHACGAEPAVLLAKMDLLDLEEDRAAVLEEARAAAGAAPVLAVSATTGEGVDAVRALLAQGRTAVFVGASGAGKSTLVNALVGEDVQATSEVRPRDARGRHRTTGRRLFVLETGGAVIDGPGIRELKLWDADGPRRGVRRRRRDRGAGAGSATAGTTTSRAARSARRSRRGGSRRAGSRACGSCGARRAPPTRALQRRSGPDPRAGEAQILRGRRRAERGVGGRPPFDRLGRTASARRDAAAAVRATSREGRHARRGDAARRRHARSLGQGTWNGPSAAHRSRSCPSLRAVGPSRPCAPGGRSPVLEAAHRPVT